MLLIQRAMILTINRSIVSITLRISNAVISITSFLPEGDWRTTAYRIEVAPQNKIISRQRDNNKLTHMLINDKMTYKRGATSRRLPSMVWFRPPYCYRLRAVIFCS